MYRDAFDELIKPDDIEIHTIVCINIQTIVCIGAYLTGLLS